LRPKLRIRCLIQDDAKYAKYDDDHIEYIPFILEKPSPIAQDLDYELHCEDKGKQ
jgi:hypothetical protein